MPASAKEKFDAAVKVIRSLPKEGSFQPSHQLMLKFYAYFKQATEGPNRNPKPSFWDIVNKAKWEAWTKLGDMPREEAMLKYVEELKTIIETMPQTENVADFMETLDNFYVIVEEKMPFTNGDAFRRGIPLSSIEETLKTVENSAAIIENVREQLAISSSEESDFDNKSNSEAEKDSVGTEQFQADTDTEGDEFCDSSDTLSQLPQPESPPVSQSKVFASTPATVRTVHFSNVNSYISPVLTFPKGTPASLGRNLTSTLTSKWPLSDSLLVNYSPNQTASDSLFSKTGTAQSNHVYPYQGTEQGDLAQLPVQMNSSEQQLLVALTHLQENVSSLQSRMAALEKLQTSQTQKKKIKWWPFPGLSGGAVAFVVVWPLLVHLILFLLFKRKSVK